MENVPPPPSYDEVFPDRTIPKKAQDRTPDAEVIVSRQYTISEVLQGVTKIDILLEPVMSERLSEYLIKKYTVQDNSNGNELLFAKEIQNSDKNIRGLSLCLFESGDSVLYFGYDYAPTFDRLEMSLPDGTTIGSFQRQSLGVGLCGCLCLCCCCPVSHATLLDKNARQILTGDAFMFPRKIDLFRPGAQKLVTIDVQRMNYDNVCGITFQNEVTTEEKTMILGIAIGMMDYEQIHKSRGGYRYHDNDIIDSD